MSGLRFPGKVPRFVMGFRVSALQRRFVSSRWTMMWVAAGESERWVMVLASVGKRMAETVGVFVRFQRMTVGWGPERARWRVFSE
ncbi:MAG: hypothetical protein ACSHX7_12845 [Luteolibacter sp.]